MPISISMYAAVLPMLLYLFILWKMDKYDREPLSMILFHFLWGAFGAVLLGIGGSLTLVILLSLTGNNSQLNYLIQSVLIAPVTEEFAKGIILFFTIRTRRFDNITDGLVYGGAVGLGFGMTENFLYFITFGNTITSWIYIVIIRSLFSAVMHCIASGIFGASLGLSKFSENSFRKLFPVGGILLAILIHFSWNASVMFAGTYLLGILFIILSVILFIFIFNLSLSNERRIITQELQEECGSGLIPLEHINILNGSLRFKRGWIDEHVRKVYCRNAIRLAFNKYELRRVKGSRRQFYEKEIELNRDVIRILLSNIRK